MPHTDQVADGFLLVVGRVVEDLLAADGIDGGPQPAHQQREHVVGPPGVHPGHEQRAAPGLDGLQQRLADLGRRVRAVVHAVQGRRDHHRARAQRTADVLDRTVRAHVTGSRVHDGAGSQGEHRGHIVRCCHPEASAESAELARVLADLGGVGHQHGHKAELRVRRDGPNSGAPDVARAPDHRGNHGRRVTRPPRTSHSRARGIRCRGRCRCVVNLSRDTAEMGPERFQLSKACREL